MTGSSGYKYFIYHAYNVYISIIITALALLTMMIPITSVYASGPRLDSYDDSTDEGARCWVNGYDSGFAGKYDKNRADECSKEKYDEYNASWDYACRDGGFTVDECNGFRNNPVEIEDYKALKIQNDRTCYDAGIEDGKTGKPFNKDRDNGCSDFGNIGGGYEGGYQFGCETHTTQASCELLYEDKEYYCPNHPDIVGCVDFLHNATNKKPAEICNSPGGCFKDQDPEKYCLNYNDSVFCKTIGDICDADGFVRPEYPYCTTD